MSVAYLVSRFPAVSHPFIDREVRALRARGVHVVTLAIKRTDPADLLSRADHDAYETTWAVRPPSWGRLLAAHVRAVVRAPHRYASTVALALKLSPGGSRRLLWQLFYFIEAISLWDHLDRTDVRHIHAHFANVGAAVAMFAAVFGGRGWSWSMTMHGSLEFYEVSDHWLPEKFRRASFVVCISDFCRSQVSRNVEAEFWDRLEVVHCGVDLDVFSPLRRVPAPGGGLRVLTIGRLAAEKGHVHLLQAIARLVHGGRDVTLTLVGDGPERERLRDLARALRIEDRVSMPGAVGQDDIVDYYARADVFCLPSFAEGVPVVLMEAMAMELAVVASRIMGIPELVDDQRSGLLVAPAREDLLVEALERLADDPALRRQLGDAARQKVAREFEISDVAAQLHDVFARRLGEVGRPEERGMRIETTA
jgi:colanic acid/amylovoran biosynthesis glycosyltransferase